jgi:hypothetical protein
MNIKTSKRFHALKSLSYDSFDDMINYSSICVIQIKVKNIGKTGHDSYRSQNQI